MSKHLIIPGATFELPPGTNLETLRHEVQSAMESGTTIEVAVHIEGAKGFTTVLLNGTALSAATVVELK